MPPRSVHRLDEPTRLSLGVVASPQSPLPFRPAKVILPQVRFLPFLSRHSVGPLIQRVFAVLPFDKFAGHPFLSPDLLPRPFGLSRKVGVSLSEIAADEGSAQGQRLGQAERDIGRHTKLAQRS